MYRYKIAQAFLRYKKKGKFYSRYPDYDWFKNYVAWFLDGQPYFYYCALKDWEQFTYCSPKRLQQVPMNGILFPVRLFDEVKIS